VEEIYFVLKIVKLEYTFGQICKLSECGMGRVSMATTALKVSIP
jgi:hypothetical protein